MSSATTSFFLPVHSSRQLKSLGMDPSSSGPLRHFAALLTIFCVAIAQDGVDKIGRWGDLIEFPLIPVAAAIVSAHNHSTQLFTYSAYSDFKFGGQTGRTQSAWLDLETGNIRHAEIANTNHDMFCPGMTSDADGKIFVSGGQNAEVTSIYDFETQSWTRGPDMALARGCQSSCITSKGEIFQIDGSFSGGIGGQNNIPLKRWRSLSKRELGAFAWHKGRPDAHHRS